MTGDTSKYDGNRNVDDGHISYNDVDTLKYDGNRNVGDGHTSYND